MGIFGLFIIIVLAKKHRHDISVLKKGNLSSKYTIKRSCFMQIDFIFYTILLFMEMNARNWVVDCYKQHMDKCIRLRAGRLVEIVVYLICCVEIKITIDYFIVFLYFGIYICVSMFIFTGCCKNYGYIYYKTRLT